MQKNTLTLYMLTFCRSFLSEFQGTSLKIKCLSWLSGSETLELPLSRQAGAWPILLFYFFSIPPLLMLLIKFSCRGTGSLPGSPMPTLVSDQCFRSCNHRKDILHVWRTCPQLIGFWSHVFGLLCTLFHLTIRKDAKISLITPFHSGPVHPPTEIGIVPISVCENNHCPGLGKKPKV